MYISLFWIGVLTTILVEIGLILLVAWLGHLRYMSKYLEIEPEEDNNNA